MIYLANSHSVHYFRLLFRKLKREVSCWQQWKRVVMKFENMIIWQKSARLSAELFKSFAHCKDFGFKDQITRAGLSIPSNIAEGAERSTQKDFIRFLQYAKGSCGELRTQMYIGMNIGYIEAEQGKVWIGETREISAMLVSFINSINRHINADN